MGIFETLGLVIPELALAIGAMVLLLVGVFSPKPIAKEIAWAAIGLLVLVGALVYFNAPGGVKIFDGAFALDAFSTFSKVIIMGAAAIAILMSMKFITAGGNERFEYSVLIVLATFGMALMVSANDLIALYMAVEMQSLSLYVLAAYNRDSRRSSEAGLKYFVLGALSSGMMLYGSSLIYGFAGATGFDDIARAASASDNNVGLIIGLVFLISGLAFKISAAPFHMWTPDVYQGAPTPVTAFFAAAPKLAGMALFARVLITSFPELVSDWRPIIAMIAIASMAVGAFSAIAQTNIKRLMAYSSIGHMGYALVGLAAATPQGVSAVLIYMAIYIVMTIGAFACILMMRRQGGLTESIEDLSGLTKTNMPLAIILTVLLFSLAGVPPLAGFFGKWYVFLAAVDAGLVWLAIAGVFASAISAFYYLRIVWFMWFEDAAAPFERDRDGTLPITAWASAILIFPVLTIFIGALRRLAENAAGALF